MIQKVQEMSSSEGLPQSRLPQFTPEESDILRGSFDFIALTHFTSDKVRPADEGTGDHPSHTTDVGVYRYRDPNWGGSAASWLKLFPSGIRSLMVWIKDNFNNPAVLVTGNGFADWGEIEDFNRANYHKYYLYETLRAMFEEGCNIIGYTAWSLVDGFEFESGYT